MYNTKGVKAPSDGVVIARCLHYDTTRSSVVLAKHFVAQDITQCTVQAF
jgi:hypothetical protein